MSGVLMMKCVYRVMQDRREQARQDLKGLEETVVGHFVLGLRDDSYIFVCVCVHSLITRFSSGQRAADSS